MRLARAWAGVMFADCTGTEAGEGEDGVLAERRAVEDGSERQGMRSDSLDPGAGESEHVALSRRPAFDEVRVIGRKGLR